MIGNAGQKIQNIVDLAEELYERVNQLREQIAELRETVEDFDERQAELESSMAEQRALLEALADEQGIDVEETLAAVSADGEDAGGEADDEAAAPVEDRPDDAPEPTAADQD